MTERLVLEDPAAAAADRLLAAARAGGHVALAGGSTPASAYERAAAAGGDWERCTLWFGDERCVPADDERSNYRLAKESLLDRISGTPPQVRRIAGELGPERAASEYESLLRETFGDSLPRLDLVLLGLGPDGHCASLFPGDPALGERGRHAVGVENPGMAPHVPRVTLTLPVLNAARAVVFLVAGAEKAPAVARAFGGGAARDVPASLVSPESGSLTVLLDRAAAADLPVEAPR